MPLRRTGRKLLFSFTMLELLIGACCPKGGVVLDPFCGSGTTLVAAAHLERRTIGIDCGGDAIALARERLASETAPT